MHQTKQDTAYHWQVFRAAVLSVVTARGVHDGAAAPAQAEVKDLVEAAARGGGWALG